MKPRNPYWEVNPNWREVDTAFHEALHAAAARLLGWHAERIVVDRNYYGYCRTVYPVFSERYKLVALHLAPALVGDLSEGDRELVDFWDGYRRGAAWRWLKKNRRSILLRARRIEKIIGPQNSTVVTFTRDGAVKNWRRTTGRTQMLSERMLKKILRGTAEDYMVVKDWAAEVRKLEAVVELVPHLHNRDGCVVVRKRRAMVTGVLKLHGYAPCQMCDALADLEDA
ncbi:hypothetical protein LCGC14_0660120 [marine sediment metagenome]|uniref:Uncharacterized protein n=1 Tax=marine sediment metagenome TaxID=412755 RepID=A0A0F9QYR1_9ZZZZ